MIKIEVSDNEFIKGATIKLVEQGEFEGYYEVENHNEIRKFYLRQYYDLQKQNCTFLIDEKPRLKEKLKVIDSEILNLKNQKLANTHTETLRLIQMNIEHLESIKRYFL